jgi:hypothetical protein
MGALAFEVPVLPVGPPNTSLAARDHPLLDFLDRRQHRISADARIGPRRYATAHPRLPHILSGHAWRDLRWRHPLGDGCRLFLLCALCSPSLAGMPRMCRHGLVGPQIPGGFPHLGPGPAPCVHHTLYIRIYTGQRLPHGWQWHR